MPYFSAISLWLKSLIIAVMLMVVVGGATRLTHSGLSMAKWKPLHVLPPLNDAQWLEEFATYQQTPEYQKINKGMELEEFKQIFWWEYGHRLIARLLGFLTLLPLVFFFKSMPNWLKGRMAAVLLLGGLQGVIGWWMVKSGLKDNPAVSHMRLAVHLLMAFLLLAILARTLWRWQGKKFTKMTPQDLVLLGLVSFTILYGAFVAGLKAGLLYNTFPLMEGQFLPGEWNFYKPIYLNFLNNPTTVQWCHRMLAMATLLYTLALWWGSGGKYRLLSIKMAVQVMLGVVTLLSLVSLPYALVHQAWAMVVWLVALKTVWVENKI